jgi:hypothetical protein
MLLALVSALSPALSAHASERRVALVQGDAELLRALTLALSAWDVETVPSQAELPEPAQPQAARQAAALARELGVDAVVWISQSAEGAVLWVYDARSGEATTRVLTESPPFSGASAAGVALSVKTALRASVEPPSSPPPKALVVPRPSARPHERGRERVTLKLAAQAHLIAEERAAARFGLGSVLWLTARPRLGLGLELSGGEAVSIASASFAGSYRDLAFGSALHLRLLARERLAASLFAGGALHAALLSGSVTGEAQQAVVKRYNLSVDAGAQLDLRLGAGVFIGLSGQVSYLPAYQRYLVQGAPVFAPWPLSVSAGGHGGVEL